MGIYLGKDTGNFVELHFEPELVQVHGDTDNDDDTQDEHILRSPFHVFGFFGYFVAVFSPGATVDVGQPEGEENVQHRTGGDDSGSCQCIPVGSQEFTYHVVSFFREDGYEVHRHVKCQEQDKKKTGEAHHHLFPDR